MEKIFIVKEYMKKKLITVQPEMNIFTAIDILIKNHISGMPVVDKKGSLIGILSERDCLDLLLEDYNQSSYLKKVIDFMSKDPVTISADASLFSVAEMLIEKNYRRLPVLDNKKLVGQISRHDILFVLKKLSSLEKTSAKHIKKRTATSLEKRKTSLSFKKFDYIENLIQAIKNINSWDPKYRPLNSQNKPGGLIEFPVTDDREFIIVGDLHANKKNLKAILQDSKNLNKLKDNKAVFVFLGDAIHDERMGHTLEMQTSIEIMDIIIRLFIKYPQNIIYLLGNHDTFSDRLSKSGNLQGVAYHDALYKIRGEKYVELMQKFFNSIPLFIKHPNFLAMHAGPVRGGLERKDLIDIRKNENYLLQITWNRVNETRSTPNQKEYGPDDLDVQRKKIKCPNNIPIIVGHNNFWKWGGKDSIWENVLNCHDHVVLLSNHEKVCPYLSFKGSFDYEKRYANLKIKARRFVMDDY